MRALVLALAAICGAACTATVVFAYFGAFTSSVEIWTACFVSLVLTVVTGCAISLLWEKAVRS